MQRECRRRLPAASAPLPFTIHICINGREWLCVELTAVRIGFRRQDNCVTHVENFEAAQTLLNAQPWADWTGALNGLVARACPALRDLTFRGKRLNYYWSGDETELATDILFRSPKSLKELYGSFLGEQVRHLLHGGTLCAPMSEHGGSAVRLEELVVN